MVAVVAPNIMFNTTQFWAIIIVGNCIVICQPSSRTVGRGVYWPRSHHHHCGKSIVCFCHNTTKSQKDFLFRAKKIVKWPEVRKVLSTREEQIIPGTHLKLVTYSWPLLKGKVRSHWLTGLFVSMMILPDKTCTVDKGCLWSSVQMAFFLIAYPTILMGGWLEWTP